jgi:hypothetical protein
MNGCILSYIKIESNRKVPIPVKWLISLSGGSSGGRDLGGLSQLKNNQF